MTTDRGGRWFAVRPAWAPLRLLVGAALAVVVLSSGFDSVQPIAAAATSDPVIAAAGDIACDPTNSNFNQLNGTSGSCRAKYTSNLLVNGGYAAILPLGDNQYYCGGYQAFQQSYDPTWGRLKSLSHPAVGNHEYLTSGGTGCDATGKAGGYYTYFGGAAGNPAQGYYSYDVGSWHLIALNTNCSAAGGCGATSPQGKWLQADLASHANLCTLAYFHIPLYSSGGRASVNAKSFWQSLYNANADLVLTAHDHTYERFAPQDANGTLDIARGMREFVVGTGGANHTSFTTVAVNSEVRNANTFGVLQVTLHPTSYDWVFVPEAGGTFTDSGTTACHGTMPDTTPPTAPSSLSATVNGSARLSLAWTASTDNVGVTSYQVIRNGVQIGASTTTSYADATVAGGTRYSYTVNALDAAGNVSPPSNTATVTTPLDNTPPTTPTNLTATPTGNSSVALSWTASTDDSGVAPSYRVFRDGTQVGVTMSTSYTDQGLQAASTHSYYVVAVDSSGNASAPSATVSVTLAQTLVLTPSDDSQVQQGNPTMNYGNSSQIGVDASPVTDSLLKFTVSGVGTKAVASAKIRLYCVNGSKTGANFYSVANSNWSESSVTWNTAPAANAGTLATLGAVAAGSWYEVDVTSFIKGDGTYSLRMTSTNADGAFYASKESTPGNAPQLVVTVS